jgi:hypothetical protein
LQCIGENFWPSLGRNNDRYSWTYHWLTHKQ